VTPPPPHAIPACKQETANCMCALSIFARSAHSSGTGNELHFCCIKINNSNLSTAASTSSLSGRILLLIDSGHCACRIPDSGGVFSSKARNSPTALRCRYSTVSTGTPNRSAIGHFANRPVHTTPGLLIEPGPVRLWPGTRWIRHAADASGKGRLTDHQQADEPVTVGVYPVRSCRPPMTPCGRSPFHPQGGHLR
jgi:hypothetical protein